MNDTFSHGTQLHSSFNFIGLIDVLIWPIVLVIIFLLLRKPLVNLLKKVTKIGYAGSSIELQQNKSTTQNFKKTSNIDKALGLFMPETIEFFRAAVIKEAEINEIPEDSGKVERLTNYSIALYIIKNFEIIYNNLYGSQIRILQQLNSNYDESRSTIIRFYDLAKEQYKALYENYSYEEYLGFLFNLNLIIEESDTLKLTILGRDFLKYLTDTGKDLNKLF